MEKKSPAPLSRREKSKLSISDHVATLLAKRPEHYSASSEGHNQLIDDILIVLGSSLHCRVWSNETGAAYRKGQMIRYGLIGSADILGLLNTGHFLGLEGKTGNARQSEQQVRFETMVKRFKGYYYVARSPQLALEYVKSAIAHANSRMEKRL